MSLRLVLNHYLASLRERDELDALLPELLEAMGHTVISRPQVGVAQAGVDIVSTFAEDGAHEEVFLWVLKFGDVGRPALMAGPQAIEPSVREACTDFAEHRLDAVRRALPKRVVVVSNGELRQEAQALFTGLVDQIERYHRIRVEFWGASELTPLIEEHLFDEALLLGPAKSDLRAALAGLEDTEAAVHRFVRFVDGCLTAPAEGEPRTPAARTRDFLRRCAAAAMGFGVLCVWGRAENNLKPGAIGGDYLMLRLWAAAAARGLESEPAFVERFMAVLGAHLEGLDEYFGKVREVLLSPRELVGYRPNHVFYTQLLFEELGRLATFLIALQYLDAPAAPRQGALGLLHDVLRTHAAWRRPVLDEQSIDLALVFVALLRADDDAAVRGAVQELLRVLRWALRKQEFLPVDSDLLEDAIAAQITRAAPPDAFFENSNFVPMLGAVSALIGDEALFTQVRELQPSLEGVTLERWWPSAALETFTGSGQDLTLVGVSQTLDGFRPTAAEEARSCREPPEHAAACTDFRWHGTPAEMLVAISARLHRHPVPTWFLSLAVEEGARLRDVEPTTGGEGVGADVPAA